MRGLGRLIVGGGGFFSRCTNTYNLAAAARYIQSTRYHTEAAEIAGGPEFTNNGKELEKQSMKGDIISLNDLLFTSNRDYLVKNNNEHVKAEELKGKVIALYFLPLYSRFHLYTKEEFTSALKDVYNDLLPLNNFEVVLVAMDDHCEGGIPVSPTKDPQEQFEDLFSFMPWTAIPFSDAGSRKHIERRLIMHGEYALPAMLVIDSTGMILRCCDVWPILRDFGALGHPFSDKRINFLRAEDDAAAKKPSLNTLIASPQRSYVISNKGDQVPIDTLKDKVVALYFYYVDMPNHSLTNELKFVYDVLAKLKKKFEVVLIFINNSHVDDWEESCRETFKSMPWLALPFRDESCKKLKRIFKLSYDGQNDPNKLVIVGPHAEFVEPFGTSVLLYYNVSAYPFTRKIATELETEKVKELKLNMLWDPYTVLRRNHGFERVSFSELFGKRVMLVLERNVNYDFSEDSADTMFALMLKGRYLQTRGTDDEFEVIRIIIDNTESSTGEHLDLGSLECLLSLHREHADMDWFVTLASKLKLDLSSSRYWYGESYSDLESYFQIFAFDRNGRLVRKTMYPTFENMEFPFYAGSLEEETLAQLSTTLLNY